jgi:hypothetical protein
MGRTADNEVPAPESPAADEGRAGRVVVDARGRNVWQWARAALDSTSLLLKRLENKDLALEPTQKVPIMSGAGPGNAKSPVPGKQTARAKPGAQTVEDEAEKKPAKRPDPMRGQVRRDGGGGFDPYNTR